jgi:hypothetical protein
MVISVNLLHNAPIELPPVQSFLARAPRPAWSFFARVSPPSPRASPSSPFPPPPATIDQEDKTHQKKKNKGPGSAWKNFSGTARTDRQTDCNFNI